MINQYNRAFSDLATAPQANWVPLLNMPNHPEFPSAHGCLTGAEAEVISAILGTNRINFTFWGATNGGSSLATTRTFAKVEDLEHEIINARVWIGFHNRTSVVQGIVLGRKVAHYALKHDFLPAN